MLQLENARSCGGSRGLERFAPAEREGAVTPGTLTLTIPFWKLCRATPLTPLSVPLQASSVRQLRSSQKENPAGESGVFNKGQLLGGMGGSWEPSFEL